MFMVILAPIFFATSNGKSSKSVTTISFAFASRARAVQRAPIGPAPVIKTRFPLRLGARLRACRQTARGSEQAACAKGVIF